MKTAISIPDDVFESADAIADRLGMSRSELYATAVAEYIAKFQHEQITARLNAVHGEAVPVDAARRRANRGTARRSEW